MPQVIADVYLPGGRNVRRNTTPGRSVQFSGGHCIIVDNRDMPHVLGMEDVRVFPRPDAMPWAPEWLGNTDWIKAEVNWPEGWEVAHQNKEEWAVIPPDTDSTEPTEGPGRPTATDPVSTVDMTDRPWIPFSPDALLGEDEDSEDETPPPTQVEEKPKRQRRAR